MFKAIGKIVNSTANTVVAVAGVVEYGATASKGLLEKGVTLSNNNLDTSLAESEIEKVGTVSKAVSDAGGIEKFKKDQQEANELLATLLAKDK